MNKLRAVFFIFVLLLGSAAYALLGSSALVAEDYDPHFAIGLGAEKTYEDHTCLLWDVTTCNGDRAMVLVNTGNTWQECQAGPFQFKRFVTGTGDCPGPMGWSPADNPPPGTYGCVRARCFYEGGWHMTNPHSAVVLASDDWQDYETSTKMFIYGEGMGDGGEYTNPQSLEIPSDATWLQVQIAGIGEEPTGVGIDTAVQSDVPGELVYDGESLWVYEAGLLPSTYITATVDGVNGHPRALVAYAKYATQGVWTSVGLTLDESVHHSAYTETVAIPGLEALETHVYVHAVVIDNNDDDRPICIRAEAGGKFAECCEGGPTHGDGLNIFALTLWEVPQGTSEVYVTIESPVEGGDSARLIGINVSHQHLE